MLELKMKILFLEILITKNHLNKHHRLVQLHLILMPMLLYKKSLINQNLSIKHQFKALKMIQNKHIIEIIVTIKTMIIKVDNLILALHRVTDAGNITMMMLLKVVLKVSIEKESTKSLIILKEEGKTINLITRMSMNPAIALMVEEETIMSTKILDNLTVTILIEKGILIKNVMVLVAHHTIKIQILLIIEVTVVLVGQILIKVAVFITK